jgi:hypothetical protein
MYFLHSPVTTLSSRWLRTLLLTGECGEHIMKGNKMKSTYAIGDIYTTTKTQETGTIKEIVVIKPDLVKIRLDVAGETRWTTWKPE